MKLPIRVAAAALATTAALATLPSHAFLGSLLSPVLSPTQQIAEDLRDVEPGQVLAAGRTIEGQYIIAFEDDAGAVTNLVEAIQTGVGGQFLGELPIINGAVMRLDDISATLIAGLPQVRYVEQDQIMETTAPIEQDNATWGLDRSDARTGLDGVYAYPSSAGTDAHIYVIDTGLLTTHSEFTGRVGEGRNFVGAGGPIGLPIPLLGPLLGGLLGGGGDIDPTDETDCNGHGTHVAGTAAGSTYGMAKKATVHGVRVLDCNGSGANSGVIAGVDWVSENAEMPAVANMSLGGGASTALDEAVRNAGASGVVMVVAAGNSDADACGGSPNRVDEAITVGSTARGDERSGFSNFGTCVDVFAPGTNITSAWHTGDTATNTISGTSMASPHVAGAAALYLGAGVDQADVFNGIIQDATPGVISGAGTGSPNLLLYIDPSASFSE